jgi:subtilase family serine protease
MEIAKQKTYAISITTRNKNKLDSYYNKTMMLNYNKQNKTLKESTMMTSYRNTLSISNTINRKKY